MMEDLVKKGFKPDRFHSDLPASPLALPFITETNFSEIESKAIRVRIEYSADQESSIEFNLAYSAAEVDVCHGFDCKNGKCVVESHTGQPMCQCPVCDSGAHCEKTFNACTAAAKRKCKIQGGKNCVPDEDIKDYCAFKCGVNSFLYGIDDAAQIVNVKIVPNFYQISSQIHQYFRTSTPELLFHKAPNRKVQWIQIRAIERPQILRQKRADALVSGKWIVLLAPWAVAQS
ncbi:hypothetical protein Y032_0002g1121 [Ancylostoma ceylanicum]|nr:hypothetical protein Y032_0002g1121 [Ancylostoma ceylanicum]